MPGNQFTLFVWNNTARRRPRIPCRVLSTAAAVAEKPPHPVTGAVPYTAAAGSSQATSATNSTHFPLEFSDQKKNNNNNSNITDLVQQLERAAAWNHHRTGKKHDVSLWDPEFCRSVTEQYEEQLHSMLSGESSASIQQQEQLLAPETVIWALKALTKSRYDLPTLQEKVRAWEKALGQLEQTPLTPALTLRLLLTNSKAGNVGRVLALLQLRKTQPNASKTETRREFQAAIAALQAGQFPQRYTNRNIQTSQDNHHKLEDPTRWLDAILVHMQHRNVALDTALANQMLDCFAVGRTGKALHHFYRIHRVPFVPHDEGEESDDTDSDHGMDATAVDDTEDDFDSIAQHMPTWQDFDDRRQPHNRTTGSSARQPIKVQLRYHERSTPPHYKIPSASSVSSAQAQYERQVDFSYPLAAAFSFVESLQHGACGHAPIVLNSSSYTALIKICVYRGALHRGMELLQEQQERFGTPNAPGGTPNVPGNVSTKKHLYTTVTEQQDGDIGKTEDAKNHASTKASKAAAVAEHKLRHSYNLVLAALARVGDISKAQEVYMQLLAAGLQPDAWTVRAVLDGLMNMGDLSGAVTATQDFFNQHGVLPPYTTHLKLLEFALASDQVYEAKRHVYFLQQLWHWKPNEYHSEEVKKLMKATQANPQLQKEALQHLFAYFGEELTEQDFL